MTAVAPMVGAVVPAAPAAGPPPLPCLNSDKGITPPTPKLPPYARKQAYALQENVRGFAESYGLSHLLDITLTMEGNVIEHSKFQKKWRSLRTNILNDRFLDWLRVKERQGRGAIHAHTLCAGSVDYRAGFDFMEWDVYREQYAAYRGKHGSGRGFHVRFRSANPALRAEWAFWSKTAKRYGFGRVTVLPIRTSEEVIGKYYGKYVGKDFQQRLAEDKGARLIDYAHRGGKRCTMAFAWNGPSGWLWRRKVELFAQALTLLGYPVRPESFQKDLQRLFGPRWAYNLREIIQAINVDYYPTPAHVRADGGVWPETIPYAVDIASVKREIGQALAPWQAAQVAIKFLKAKGGEYS